MLTDQLRNYIDAAFAGLWIESYEPLEAIREISELCKAESWNIVTWNIDQGFMGTDTVASDPLSAVKAIGNLDNSETPLLVVLQNFHRFLGSIEIIQTLERQIQDGKVSRTFVIVLSPIVQIPPELEKLFTVIEHPLPTKDQLREIATEILGDGELPDEFTLHRVINAAAGMTIEKSITTGGNDGGVSARILGTILQWLNDRESDSFIVCTANDISKLPTELTRAERFDGIFFVDLPDRVAKDQIWSIYEQEYGLENPKRPDDEGWTGAEIKACCRLSKLLDVTLVEAAQNVVPVAQTAAESINALRTWASGRCLDASKPGVYRYKESPRRNIRRNDPPSGAVA